MTTDGSDERDAIVPVDGNGAERGKRPGGVTGKGFRKGQSGNPGGVPKGLKELKELARKHSTNAIARLAELMEEDGAVGVAACNSILDRGWGKPTQAVEVSGPEGGPMAFEALEDLTDEQLEQLERTLAKAVAVAGSGGESPDTGAGSGGEGAPEG